jgi:AcrR family transcriptional regulator
MRKPAVKKRVLRIPKQARSRRTREKVLSAAVSCFEELGYDETNTAEIARRARIAVGSLYGYFKDKREILLELLDATIRQIAEYTIRELDPELWKGRSHKANIRRVIDALFHTRHFNPGMQRILWERYFKDPQFHEAVTDIEARVRGALVHLLSVLKSDGQLRIRDVDTAAFVVYTAIEWTASRLILSESEVAIDDAVAATSDMVARFLLK